MDRQEAVFTAWVNSVVAPPVAAPSTSSAARMAARTRGWLWSLYQGNPQLQAVMVKVESRIDGGQLRMSTEVGFGFGFWARAGVGCDRSWTEKKGGRGGIAGATAALGEAGMGPRKWRRAAPVIPSSLRAPRAAVPPEQATLQPPFPFPLPVPAGAMPAQRQGPSGRPTGAAVVPPLLAVCRGGGGPGQGAHPPRSGFPWCWV